MKFICSRTSKWHKEKPCKEAKSVEATYQDSRTAKTLAEAKLPRNAHWATGWFDSGTNHREENGHVVRDLEAEGVWVIDIKTLEELHSFYQKYGDIIITESDYKEYPLEIEIYDGYRE